MEVAINAAAVLQMPAGFRPALESVPINGEAARLEAGAEWLRAPSIRIRSVSRQWPVTTWRRLLQLSAQTSCLPPPAHIQVASVAHDAMSTQAFRLLFLFSFVLVLADRVHIHSFRRGSVSSFHHAQLGLCR